MSILPVELNMESFVVESSTCGVVVNAVDTDGGITGRISKKIDALVGVCKITAGKCVSG